MIRADLSPEGEILELDLVDEAQPARYIGPVCGELAAAEVGEATARESARPGNTRLFDQ